MKLYAIAMVAMRYNIVHYVADAGQANNDDEMIGIALRFIKKECPPTEAWNNHNAAVWEITQEYALNTFERNGND